MRRHFLVGAGSAILLIIVYSALIVLAQGWAHALEQSVTLWYWVIALAAGFGTQVGLFSFIKGSIRQRQIAAGSSVGTSGAISTGSMAACCAHHLSDVLPLLGLSGLALFLTRYQLFFIVLGLLSNVIGIIIILETIQRHGLSQRISGWKWSMNRIKKVAIVSSAVISVALFLVLLIY
ncbi:MAG: hypothetical protein HYX83_00260 [Chloroflexi bacterium]|nr:hypothetical protein [Chloroflexota bacterium]